VSVADGGLSRPMNTYPEHMDISLGTTNIRKAGPNGTISDNKIKYLIEIGIKTVLLEMNNFIFDNNRTIRLLSTHYK
jgi:hypothetical protein